MSLHSEEPGPPKQTRQVFAVTSKGGQIMRVGKTEQDHMPVAERPRVIAWKARLQKAKAKHG